MKILSYNESFYFTVSISRIEAAQLEQLLQQNDFITRNEYSTNAPAMRDITIFCEKGIKSAAIAQQLIESI